MRAALASSRTAFGCASALAEQQTAYNRPTASRIGNAMKTIRVSLCRGDDAQDVVGRFEWHADDVQRVSEGEVILAQTAGRTRVSMFKNVEQFERGRIADALTLSPETGYLFAR